MWVKWHEEVGPLEHDEKLGRISKCRGTKALVQQWDEFICKGPIEEPIWMDFAPLTPITRQFKVGDKIETWGRWNLINTYEGTVTSVSLECPIYYGVRFGDKKSKEATVCVTHIIHKKKGPKDSEDVELVHDGLERLQKLSEWRPSERY